MDTNVSRYSTPAAREILLVGFMWRREVGAMAAAVLRAV